MELKEFVKETLYQIIIGVTEAQNAVKDTNAEVSPTGLHFSKDADSRVIFKLGRGIVQIVGFDVAVTTTDSSSSKGGAGIFVGPLGIGGQGGTA